MRPDVAGGNAAGVSGADANGACGVGAGDARSLRFEIGGKLLMEKVKYKIDGKKVSMDIASDILGSLLMGAGVYIFAAGSNFATGGVSGIALMLNHIFGIPMGSFSLFMNIPLILISYRILGRKFLLCTLRTLVIQAMVFDYICVRFPVYEGEALLAALYTGVLMGAGLAVIYIRDSSTGGSDLIIMSIHKLKPHMSIGSISLMIDGCIIMCGIFVFGKIDAVLYGVIASTCCTIVMDKIVAGTGSGKIAMVICDDGMKVADAISEATERGSTMIKAMGPYTGKERDVVICACSKREIFKVRHAAYAVDPGALIMVLRYDETFGYGFKRPEQRAAQLIVEQKEAETQEAMEMAKAVLEEENSPEK